MTKKPLQELLSFIPLYQLTFITPIAKELIYYDQVIDHIPGNWLEKRTILTLSTQEDLESVNRMDIANTLIQDPALIGIVISAPEVDILDDDMVDYYKNFELPILHLSDSNTLQIFKQDKDQLYTFSQINNELVGTMNEGLIVIAEKLSKGLATPIVYLDSNNNIIWSEGEEEDLDKVKQWMNLNKLGLEEKNYLNSYYYQDELNEAVAKNKSFDLYEVTIVGMESQSLLVVNQLSPWQKKLIDKFIGLTSILVQADKMFQEQQSLMQEHFIYDLLYHKFESHSVMVSQGKSWGWNLEKGHHLLIINVEMLEKSPANAINLTELAEFITVEENFQEKNIHAFSFQENLVILVEDDQKITKGQRKKAIMNFASKLIKSLASLLPDYSFSIGIGKWYKDSTYLNKSYQEAKLALKFGAKWFEHKRVNHINDLGVLRLLVQIHPEILLDFQDDYLQDLIESDRNNGTEYIKTLEVYIQCDEVINDVSEQLYVHPNTLRNRLRKIEELTGMDLQNSDEFMNLSVAIKLLSFLTK